MWEGNNSRAGSLESIILDGAERILVCLQIPATRQLEDTWSLKSSRDRANMKWCYKLATLP